MIGKSPDYPESYGLINVLMIYLNEKQDKQEKSIFHLLNTVFSPTVKPEDKTKILEKDFDFKIDQDLGDELDHMCNLSEAIEEKALERGMERGMEKGIQALINVCKSVNLSKDITIQKLKEEFELSDEAVAAALKKYWK